MIWVILAVLWIVVAGVGSGLDCLIHDKRGVEFFDNRMLWLILCPIMLVLFVAATLQLGIFKKLYWPWYRINKKD